MSKLRRCAQISDGVILEPTKLRIRAGIRLKPADFTASGRRLNQAKDLDS